MLPLALGNCLVVGHGKAHIVLVRHDVDPREPRLHHVDRTVDASVVHNPNVHGHPFLGAFHRNEALFEKGPNVVTHDDDTQVCHPLYGNRFNKELDNVASSAYCNASPTATPRASAVSNTFWSFNRLAK